MGTPSLIISPCGASVRGQVRYLKTAMGDMGHKRQQGIESQCGGIQNDKGAAERGR
jgi:hypothetical protein